MVSKSDAIKRHWQWPLGHKAKPAPPAGVWAHAEVAVVSAWDQMGFVDGMAQGQARPRSRLSAGSHQMCGRLGDQVQALERAAEAREERAELQAWHWALRAAWRMVLRRLLG